MAAMTNGFFPQRKPTDIELKRATIANAVATGTYVIGIGSALQPGATGGGSTTAYAHDYSATGATSSGLILGVVKSILFNGKVTELSYIVGANSASTGLSLTANVYTDNETTGYWQVDYIPSNVPLQYTATLDGAAGTSASGDTAGIASFPLATVSASVTPGSGTLHEASGVIWSGTTVQFTSYGPTAVGGKSVVGHWSYDFWI